ncbi:MAG: hypothetical protein IT225_11665 [Flavobacteriales bacterium]|nr:hypothetical protein [Flavobacteriales bacterium]
MSEDQRKHLELLQNTITRMAVNSFLIKGWSVTLVAALFALAAKDSDRSFAIVSYFPCILFWCLDGYYLAQERKFRSLFEAARSGKADLYSMNTQAHARERDTWLNSIFGTTLLLFHGTIVAVISSMMVILR